MEQRTILVTGGSGFIGSHFCHSAVAQDNNVFVLSRNPRKCGHLPKQVHCVARLADIPREINFDMVLNLAGEPLFNGRWSDSKKERFYESRVGITERLFNFFSKRNRFPELMVSGSAVGYYGPNANEILDETSSFHDSFGHQLCRDWEKSAEAFESHGTRVCMLRTGLVMGRGGGMLAPLLPLFRFGLGGRMGDGEQWMSWIHIDDLQGIIFHLAQHPTLQGPVNATAPNPVTNREFTSTLAQTLNRPAFFHLPGYLLHSLLGEMGREMTVSQRVIPQKALDSGYQFSFPYLESALKNIIKGSGDSG